jgi:hypothetical protein
LALIAVVILDPSANLSPAPASSSSPITGPAPPVEPQPSPVAGPVVAASPVPRPASNPDRTSGRARLAIGAALEAVLGQGPDPAVAPRAFLELRLPAPLARGSVWLSVGRGYPSTVDTAIGSAQVTLTDVRLEPCVQAWAPGALQIHACGIADVVVLSGQGTNTIQPKSESRAVLELGFGLRPVWALSEQVSVGVLLAAALPLARYRFYFTTPDTTAYRLSAWSGFGEVGIGVRFF